MDDASFLGFMRGHHGVATRAELHGLGLNDKAIRRREVRDILEEVHPGVFWFRAVPFSWWSAMRAATCWASPAAGSHRSAAAALRLDGFAQTAVEVSTSRRVRGPEPPIIHRVPSLDPREVRTRDGVPFTVIERTLVDLGAVCPARKVEQALDDALRRSITTLERVRASLDACATNGRSGVRTLRALLDDRSESGCSESEFERALSRMTRRFNLPRPNKQHPIVCEGKGFRFDFAYPTSRVAIEAWSYKHHSLRSDWEADHARHCLATADGWRILYVTYRRLCRDPAGVADEIRRTIAGPPLF